MGETCEICNRVFVSVLTLRRHYELFHQVKVESLKSQQLQEDMEEENSEENDSDENESDDSEDAENNTGKKHCSKPSRSATQAKIVKETEEEEEEKEEEEIEISAKTVQLLENMLIGAQIGTITLSKKQIRDAVI